MGTGNGGDKDKANYSQEVQEVPEAQQVRTSAVEDHEDQRLQEDDQQLQPRGQANDAFQGP